MNDPKIPFEALEGLMRKAFIEQSVNPGLFWDALLNSHLTVPLAKDADENDKQIPILLGQDSKGGHVVWLFTSVDAMVEYVEQDLKYMTMPAPKILDRLRESTHEIVLIGPDGITLNLHPELVASLADGRVPEQPVEEVRNIPKDTSVYVGKPEDDVVALESRFIELFNDLPTVTEACFIQIADDAGSRLLLGLKLLDESRENFKSVASQVAKAAEGVLEKGKTMDITLINRSLKDAFEKWGEPFYRK